eukprot:gnl/TRDRNA2_/TRDRNA2_28814_c0_seq1.p1 gnl/TRDRNA2_/TRDRNA2_28814_c0~~gnl/TRDRNA2_/TRDRNA2_28814_c0_seq1.p1  ORF type:complete len:443 (-),score=100.15 gnl/TRDRNA2_/TRDRNA2_28814_c0_seq1:155-1312(-)
MVQLLAGILAFGMGLLLAQHQKKPGHISGMQAPEPPEPPTPKPVVVEPLQPERPPVQPEQAQAEQPVQSVEVDVYQLLQQLWGQGDADTSEEDDADDADGDDAERWTEHVDMPVAHQELDGGLVLYVNLDRREDRRVKMEKLFSPHPWLNSKYQRLPAVDGRQLTWKQLQADGIFTDKAEEFAQLCEKMKLATVKSTHLTLGGCGCALSHLRAWEELVNSPDSVQWALIFEDDVSHLTDNFDLELEAVLQALPDGWNICYLGYHTGDVLDGLPRVMLQGGRRWPGKLETMQGTWLSGLWAYMISKKFAKRALKELLPMTVQVDTEIGTFAKNVGGAYALVPGEFLAYAPKSEVFKDTDVQTFEDDVMNAPKEKRKKKKSQQKTSL